MALQRDFAEKVHNLFNNRRLRKLFLRLRFPLVALAGFGMVLHIRSAWFVPGLSLSAVGMILQLWCFSCIKTRKVLAMQGPYALVRNPMYLARFLMIAGLVLMTGNFWLFIGFTVFYYFYMVNRVKREEVVLSQTFGEDYTRYCRTVGRYIPRFTRISSLSLWGGCWENFKRNHGLENMVVMLLVYLVCYWAAFHI